jgi:chemotaxis signal transduction protein
MGGVRMGVDTVQVKEIMDIETAEEMGMRMTPLNEIIQFGGRDVILSSPKVLLLKTEIMQGVVIESPESIIDINTDDIRLMPPIVETSGSKALWGAVLSCEGIILLMDFYKLI